MAWSLLTRIHELALRPNQLVRNDLKVIAMQTESGTGKRRPHSSPSEGAPEYYQRFRRAVD